MCVATGHRHNNPCSPSQESNDLCANPRWVDLCLFLAVHRWGGGARVVGAVSVVGSGSLSEIKDYKVLGMVPPLLLRHFFLWGYLNC